MSDVQNLPTQDSAGAAAFSRPALVAGHQATVPGAGPRVPVSPSISADQFQGGQIPGTAPTSVPAPSLADTINAGIARAGAAPVVPPEVD